MQKAEGGGQIKPFKAFCLLAFVSRSIDGWFVLDTSQKQADLGPSRQPRLPVPRSTIARYIEASVLLVLRRSVKGARSPVKAVFSTGLMTMPMCWKARAYWGS